MPAPDALDCTGHADPVPPHAPRSSTPQRNCSPPADSHPPRRDSSPRPSASGRPPCTTTSPPRTTSSRRCSSRPSPPPCRSASSSATTRRPRHGCTPWHCSTPHNSSRDGGISVRCICSRRSAPTGSHSSTPPGPVCARATAGSRSPSSALAPPEPRPTIPGPTCRSGWSNPPSTPGRTGGRDDVADLPEVLAEAALRVLGFTGPTEPVRDVARALVARVAPSS